MPFTLPALLRMQHRILCIRWFFDIGKYHAMRYVLKALPNCHLQRTVCRSSKNSLQNALTFPKMLHIDFPQVLYFPESLVGNWSRSDLLQEMVSSEQVQRLYAYVYKYISSDTSGNRNFCSNIFQLMPAKHITSSMCGTNCSRTRK